VMGKNNGQKKNKGEKRKGGGNDEEGCSKRPNHGCEYTGVNDIPIGAHGFIGRHDNYCQPQQAIDEVLQLLNEYAKKLNRSDVHASSFTPKKMRGNKYFFIESDFDDDNALLVEMMINVIASGVNKFVYCKRLLPVVTCKPEDVIATIKEQSKKIFVEQDTPTVYLYTLEWPEAMSKEPSAREKEVTDYISSRVQHVLSRKQNDRDVDVCVHVTARDRQISFVGVLTEYSRFKAYTVKVLDRSWIGRVGKREKNSEGKGDNDE